MLDRLRNAEYTGENRCWPCTALNGVLLLLACACVARLLPAKRTRRLGVASALGLAGGAAISLRGYLVPGTPRIAPMLVDRLPDALSDAFPDAPFDTLAAGPRRPTETGTLVGDSDEEAGERTVEALFEAGVLHAVGETLHLDERFRADWREEMRRAREADLVAAVREAAAGEPNVEPVEGGRWIVLADGGPRSERWLPRSVAIAEVAAIEALAEWGVDADDRGPAAPALRAFLERCPSCDGDVEETTTGRCCGGGSNPTKPPETVLACRECDQRVFTF